MTSVYHQYIVNRFFDSSNVDWLSSESFVVEEVFWQFALMGCLIFFNYIWLDFGNVDLTDLREVSRAEWNSD